MIAAVESANPPLHLLFGKPAYDMVNEKLGTFRCRTRCVARGDARGRLPGPALIGRSPGHLMD